MTNRHPVKAREKHIKDEVLSNKGEREKRIEEAALALFSCNEVHQISINQITRKTRVAKNTFYLYFHNKVQPIGHLVVKESSSTINDTFLEAKWQRVDDKIDELIFLIDRVIVYLCRHPEVIKLIQKNLPWNLIGGKPKEDDNYEVVVHANSYRDFLVILGYTRSEAHQLLFMILELASTPCYTAIVLHQSDNIGQLKPTLFTAIRKMIERL